MAYTPMTYTCPNPKCGKKIEVYVELIPNMVTTGALARCPLCRSELAHVPGKVIKASVVEDK